MHEACYCGRTGEIEDRTPVLDDDGMRALESPDCGHLDRLEWLSDDARTEVFEEAGQRKARRSGRRVATRMAGMGPWCSVPII